MPFSERRRRWVRRVVYTLLGLPALAALVLIVYLSTGHPDEMVRERLVDALAESLGRPVTIDRVELRYLPPGFVGIGFRSEQPLIEAARVEMAFSLRALLGGRVVVKDIDLYDPVLDWRLDTQRFQREPSGAAAGGAGKGRFASRFDLRRLRVHRARLRIGSEIRELSAEMEGLKLHADNQETGLAGPWAGSAVFTRGRFVLGDLELEGVAGSLAFEADPSSIRTRRLRLRAEGIDILASGQVQPGTPTRGRFQANLHLDDYSPSLHRPLPMIRARNVDCELGLTLPGDGVRVTGTFTADQPSIDADLRAGPDGRIIDGPQVPWVASRGEGTFEVESGRIKVEATLFDFAGGRVEAGYVGVKDESGGETPRHHEISISATRLDLHDVLRQFELPGLQEITPSALLSADATVRWIGDESERMTGSSELIFDRAEGDLPLWGAATVAWQGDLVTIEASSLTTEGSSITVSGTVDAAAQHPALDLTARLVSDDTTALTRFLERRFPALGAAQLAPTDLAGGVEADLRVGGTTSRPSVEAVFSSAGLALSLPDATIALHSASGNLSYLNDRLALELQRIEGDGLSARGSLSMNLDRAEILAASLEARTVPADLLARLAGIGPGQLIASGTLSAGAEYAGGEGLFTLSGDALALGDLRFTALNARARLTGRELRLDEGSFMFCGGTIRAVGSADLTGGHPAGGLDFTITSIDLAKIDAEYPGPELSGLLDATGHLAIGETTEIEATFAGRDIHVAGTDLGAMSGTVAGPLDSPDGPLRIFLKDATGDITATAGISHEAMIAGDVRIRRFSLEELRPLVPPEALRGLAGDTDGIITFSGPLADPAELVIVGTLHRLSLTVADEALINESPVKVTIEGGFLTLAPMRLTGARTDLTLGGSMTLSGTYDITARLAGKFDLGLAEILAPEMRASGDGTADFRVTERADVLSYDGTLSLANGTIRHPSLPLPLENLNGSAVFSENGLLKISRLDFDTGGGHVSGTGAVQFEGLTVPSLRLDLSGKGVRAEIFPDMRAFFDAEVSIEKTEDIYKFGGNVMIQRAIYTRSFGVEASDLLLRGREFAPAKESHGEAPRMLLDLNIDAERDVWIRNEDTLIEASAHLTLQGTMDNPELSGRVSALEGGTYRFRDVTYRIVGGAIDFADLTRIDPLIDIEASTRVQSYEITLRISGRYSRPVFDLTSDPSLPQRDIAWLLITGHTIAEESSDAATTLAEGQVAAYLAAPVAGAVSAPLQKFLGVSSFQIDPFFLNGAADPSARVTVTKRLEQGLLFTYSSSLGQSGQEVYQIEYNPGTIWDVIATRDLDGSVGADLRFRRRWQGLKGSDSPDTAGGATADPEAGRPKVGIVTIVADHLTDSRRSLLRQLRFGEGDPLRRGDLLEGRETLRQNYIEHGYPAAQVDLIEEEAGTPGQPRTNVSYLIRAGERHDLEIRSEVLGRGIRGAVRKAWLEPILLEDLAVEARAAAIALLRNKGYYSATVQSSVTTPPPAPDATGAARLVTLDVTPGPRVLVRSVGITGNSEMPEDRIRRQLLTREGGVLTLFGRGRLKEGTLKEDVDAIRGLYLANGYLSVKIAPPRVTLSADGREAEIGIHIAEEGPQSRVGDIVIDGGVPGLPGEALIKATELSRTQVVTTEVINAATDRLRESLDREGYSRARVSATLSGPPAQTRVIFSITPFEQARIREVTIEGNTRTRDRIVERELTVNPGEYLSRAALLSTQKNLYRLGVFRSVQMETTAVEGKPGLVDVKIKVQEGSPILTAWGLGYDTEDRIRSTFEVANNNLFGTRRSAALFLRGSANDRRVQLTLRDPNLFGERIETLLSGFHERKESDSFDLRRLGASAQLTRKLGANTKLFGRYLLQDINLFNVQVSEDEIDERTVRLASASISLAHDTRDDIINPTRGGLTSFDFRVYHRGLYSESQFNRLFASTSNFKDLGRGVIWASSLRAGVLTSSNIPISERFFAGGDTTLRGFSYNTAGPLDPNTDRPIGGNMLFLVNQELRFPIYKALRGVVFYDTGNVFAEWRNFHTGDFRNIVGGGLRFDTPVGPFRVEYGHKLSRRREESPGEFFFSIGQAF